MISDLILSIFTFYFFFQHRTSSKLWSLFFLFIGLSALVGGIYHGFVEIGEQYRFLSWSLLSVSLIFAVFAVYAKQLNKLLKSLIILKSFTLLILSFHYCSFTFMIIDTVVSLFVFIFIGNLLFMKSLSKYISFGILISFCSVLFIAFKISPHPQYLTYNDIGHYISIISLSMISFGVKEDYLKYNYKCTKA